MEEKLPDKEKLLNKEIGKRLKQARLNAGYILREVSELVPGLAVSRLGNWETGERMPDIEFVKKLAVIYAVSSAWIMTLDDTNTKREESLLDLYRNCDERGKNTILGVAEKESVYEIEPGEEYQTKHKISGIKDTGRTIKRRKGGMQ